MKYFRCMALLLITATLAFTACDGGSSSDEGDSVVSISSIAGVTPPAYGESPVTAITETDQFSGSVTWSDSPVTFDAETDYTATIMLTAKSGYTLTGITGNFFTIAGADTVTHDADSGVVTAVFPVTAASPPSVIDLSAIPGVTLPAYGESPVTAITETDQFSGSVTWSDSPVTFDAETDYTATIRLTAKSGYTLTGITGNFFTVAGADTVTHDADSGVVTAIFPETGIKPPVVIDIAAIAGVTAPLPGYWLKTAITETDQYTGTVSWSPDYDPCEFSTEYTATITLTAKPGYTLTGITGDFFTVGGADTVTNEADSGVVTVVFPKTEAPLQITYHANGGTAGIAPTDTTEYISGRKVQVRNNTGSLVGDEVGGDHAVPGIRQRFLGWNTDSGAETAEFVAGQIFTITKNTDLYAIYTTGTDVLRKVGPAGGLIFYDKGNDDDGWRYLEVWNEDESDTYRWKTSQTTTGGTSKEIGTGEANTTSMTGDEHPAAKVVKEATHGGFSDWFLPSKNELNAIWENLVKDNDGKNSGVGGFSDNGYWSSSEIYITSAWAQRFRLGEQNNFDKDSNFQVRAVRAFK